MARKTGQTDGNTHTLAPTYIHTNTIETRFLSLSMFKNQKIKYLDVGLIPATPKERYVGTGKDILNVTPITQEWIA